MSDRFPEVAKKVKADFCRDFATNAKKYVQYGEILLNSATIGKKCVQHCDIMIPNLRGTIGMCEFSWGSPCGGGG